MYADIRVVLSRHAHVDAFKFSRSSSAYFKQNWVQDWANKRHYLYYIYLHYSRVRKYIVNDVNKHLDRQRFS